MSHILQIALELETLGGLQTIERGHKLFYHDFNVLLTKFGGSTLK